MIFAPSHCNAMVCKFEDDPIDDVVVIVVVLIYKLCTLTDVCG
jgi:hypothetical protein